MALCGLSAAGGPHDEVARAVTGAEQVAPNLCISGTPAAGWCGDGGLGTSAKLASPGSIVALPGGGIAFVDKLNDAIRELRPDGTIATLARTSCGLDQLARAPDGELIVAAPWCAQVLAVAPSGRVRILAGRKFPYVPDGFRFSEEGVPATDAELNFPTGVAVSPQGTIYIADSNGENGQPSALRFVTTEGKIGTLHTATPTNATALAFTSGGDLMALDENHSLVWRIAPTGATSIFARVRGNDMSATKDGGLLITQFRGNKVLRVDKNGLSTVAAGSGAKGLSSDGTPPASARFTLPSAATELEDGSIAISDAGNDRLREVSADGLTTSTIAGSGAPDQTVFWSAQPADTEPCRGGCGDPAYNPLLNYFYFTDLPVIARASHPFTVQLIATSAALLKITVSARGRPTTRVTMLKVTPAGEVAVPLPGMPHGIYSIHALAFGKGGAIAEARTVANVR